ncbi:MAG: hypothetical protein ACCK40_00145 [Candidatus Karelsulcia muelleri]
MQYFTNKKPGSEIIRMFSNNFLEFLIFSAKIKSTFFKIRIALKVRYYKFPIGVGTIYNIN